MDDEFLIALELADTFRDAGAEIVGPFTYLEDAERAAEQAELDLAVLDVRLGRKTTEPVARRLVRRQVPFLFYSGQPLPEAFLDGKGDRIVLDKPAPPVKLVNAALRLLDRET